MRATIRIGDIEATLEEWQWTSGSDLWVEVLNGMLDPDGPSGSDPAPNFHEAQRVAGILGTDVTDYELPEYVEGRVY